MFGLMDDWRLCMYSVGKGLSLMLEGVKNVAEYQADGRAAVGAGVLSLITYLHVTTHPGRYCLTNRENSGLWRSALREIASRDIGKRMT
jgi:hypothetical protein